MSMTSFRSDSYNLGIDLAKLKSIVPRGVANTAVANVATANATDLATAQALANQLKTTLNQLLTAVRAKGIID